MNWRMTMSSPMDIFSLALQLPESDRALLAHQLILSLETDPFDGDVETAWQQEIGKRLRNIAAGEFTASDWREALDRVRRSIRGEKPS
jgi:putative addiction module component (TIGR02574 family)